MKKTISIVLATMLILAVFAPLAVISNAADPTTPYVKMNGVVYSTDQEIYDLFDERQNSIPDGALIEVYGKVNIPFHDRRSNGGAVYVQPKYDGGYRLEYPSDVQYWYLPINSTFWVLFASDVTVRGMTPDATLYHNGAIDDSIQYVSQIQDLWSVQSFIIILGDNAKFENLTITPVFNAKKNSVNKSVEIFAPNITVTGCTFSPNPTTANEANNNAGALHFNGPKGTVLVENNTFNQAVISFDSVSSTDDFKVSNNLFNGTRTPTSSLISTTTWSTPPTFETGKIVFEENVITNYAPENTNLIYQTTLANFVFIDNILDNDDKIQDKATFVPHSSMSAAEKEEFYQDASATFIQGDSIIQVNASEDGTPKPVELPSGIALDKSIAFMKQAQTLTLTATKLSELDTRAVLWSTSDSAVLSVNAGKVTAVGDGIATITATIAGTSLSARCEILVGNIVLNKSEAYAKKGAALNLNVANLGSLNVNVEWSTSNAAVATVSNGVVTAVSNGEAVITATVAGTDLSASCKVIVTDISLDKDMYSMSINMRVELFASLEYGDLPIVWKSSNKNIALVDQNGEVYAVRQGETTITATIEGTTISDSCTIYVGQAEKTQSIIDGILEFFRMIFDFLGNLFTGR